MRVMRWQNVLLAGLALLAWASSGLAAELLTIGQLHKYHKSYALHSVTVVGKVAEMQAFPPVPVRTKNCTTLYGRATFVLIDDTGSLPVESLGTCYSAAQNLPHDGDHIKLTAIIHVYIPEGEATQVIKVIVQEIVVLR